MSCVDVTHNNCPLTGMNGNVIVKVLRVLLGLMMTIVHVFGMKIVSPSLGVDTKMLDIAKELQLRVFDTANPPATTTAPVVKLVESVVE